MSRRAQARALHRAGYTAVDVLVVLLLIGIVFFFLLMAMPRGRETARQVGCQKNLAQICQGRTVFIIAHRLSTVRPASRIYVIEKGEIIEQGTHDELLKLNGYYARLHRHQDGNYAVA